MPKTPYQITQEIKRLEQDQIYKLNTSDPKAGFTFGTKGKDEDIKNASNKFQFVLPDEPIDYTVAPVNDEKPPDTRQTLSFMNVKTIEEGIEWYRAFDPKIPEEILPIMARWNWGDLSTITKKQIRNERKKDKKKGKKAGLDTGIKIEEKPTIINLM
tara:strand:- start:633 stop:1103 length:471 start_codon:yes stop_codon:yes gene_type:complete